jgi:hypothetical protein
MLDLGSSTELITLKPWSTGKQLPLGFSVLGQEIMEVEKYIITYKIGNDIPINPDWIRDQVKAAVAEIQAKIDKKNLHGQHVLTIDFDKYNLSTY